MNDIRRGRVTNYMDDIRHSAVAEFRGGQVPGSNKLGQRPNGANWEIITRSHSYFTRTERPQPCYPNRFSPTSVQLKSEINGALRCKRHQQQHLELCTTLLRTRRPGVRIPPGAPLLANKTKAI